MDWNSDGDLDLISGDRSGYFNVWVWDDTGLVAHTQYPRLDSTPMNVGANSYPSVIDWNGDDMKDLIIGCENGQVLVWLNQTSDTWPMFQSAETVAADGQALYQYRANPVIFDLDSDGVNDLVVGDGNGYVLFYQNTGTNANPEFAAGETLMTPTGLPVQGSGIYGARCWVGYWDPGDLPDLLISASDGLVELFVGAPQTAVDEGRPTPAALSLHAGPNPTTGRSTILCEAPAGAALVVCDDLGRVVRHLGVVGDRSIRVWDGRNDSGAEVNSGVYFCRLSGSGQTASGRIVISR